MKPPAGMGTDRAASDSLSVMIVNQHDGERYLLRTAVEAMPSVNVVAERSDLRTGLALARQIEPTILVIELPHATGDTLTAVAQHKLDHPNVAVFLVADALDQDTLLKALRAGAQEVLRRPLDRAALCEAVERVAHQLAKKAGGASPRLLLTVFSNKGGCGVTTLASNLAVALRQLSDRDTVLADLDYQSGNAALVLGLTPFRSLADVLGAPQLDPNRVHSGLLRHASGIHLLAQPEGLRGIEEPTAAEIGSVLEVLYSTFDLTVVDTPHAFNSITLEIFDRSSAILLVTELTVPSVRAAQRSLEMFHRLNYTTVLDRIRLVVNRYNGNSSLPVDQVSKTLDFPIFHQIANDYAAVSRAIDVGETVCGGSSSPAARDIVALARKLMPERFAQVEAEPAGSTRRAGLFDFLRRGRR